MEIVLDKLELKALLLAAAEIGVLAYKAEAQPETDRMSQSEAFKSYTPALIREWRRKGKVHPLRVGSEKKSTLYYSRLELKTLYQAEKNQILN